MQDTDDDIPGPLLIREEPGPTLTISEAAREAFGSDHRALNRFKGLAQQGLVHRASNAPRARVAALFGITDIASAKVLGALLDLGVFNRDVMLSASMALYGWQMKDNPKPSNLIGVGGTNYPIRAALRGTAKGEWWVLALDVYRSDQTGELRYAAAVYDMDASKPAPPTDMPHEFIPHVSATIILTPLLRPLLRLLAAPRGN